MSQMKEQNKKIVSAIMKRMKKSKNRGMKVITLLPGKK